MNRNELQALWVDLLAGKLKSYSDDEGVDIQWASSNVFAVVYAKSKRVDLVSLKDFNVVKSLTSGFICNEIPKEDNVIVSIDVEVDSNSWNPNATPCWTHWETELVGVDEVLGNEEFQE